MLVGVGALSGLIGLCLKGGNTDMSTIVWIAAIVIFGVVEAATAGLTSIWFVLGSVAALIVAICNGPIWLQISLFFVVSIVTLAATRPLVAKLMKRTSSPPTPTACWAVWPGSRSASTTMCPPAPST